MQARLAAASGALGPLATWITRDWRWIIGAALKSRRVMCNRALSAKVRVFVDWAVEVFRDI
jgi:hypothetical protein